MKKNKRTRKGGGFGENEIKGRGVVSSLRRPGHVNSDAVEITLCRYVLDVGDRP